MALTPKQARFVAEYLKTRNQTESARRAGYKSPEVEGCRLLKNAKVAALVAAGQSERTERTNIDIDYVVQRLSIEAEREGEGSSHSARVSALGQLRQHFVDASGGGGADKIADALREIAGKVPG
jgi:phage terminase small subunit